MAKDSMMLENVNGILNRQIPGYLDSLGFRMVFDVDMPLVVPLFCGGGKTLYDALSEGHRMKGDVVAVPLPVSNFWSCRFHVYEGAAREWPYEDLVLELGGNGVIVALGRASIPERESYLHTAMKVLYLTGIGSYVVPMKECYFLYSAFPD